MATAEQAVRLFDSFVGTIEAPPHSNRTFIGAEFGWNGVAWCCESCWVVEHRLGVDFPKTASVAQAISDAKAGRNGLTWIPRNGVIRGGDCAVYDWHGNGNPSDFHIAMVRDPFDGTTRFQTVAGNENDSVRIQWRDRTFVQGFIRPSYSGQVVVVPPPLPVPEEDDMKGYLVTYKGGIFATDFQKDHWTHVTDPGPGSQGMYEAAGYVWFKSPAGKSEITDTVAKELGIIK